MALGQEIFGGLKDAIANRRLANEIDKSGRRWLSIPGHDAHVVRAHENKNRPWRRKQGNAEFYEETATLVFSYLLDKLKPETVFDIGAWRGHFSFLAASHAVARPTVFAFDMRPKGIAAITTRAEDLGWSGRVRPLLCGLSDTHVGPTRVWSSRMMMFEKKPREEEYRETIWRRLKFYLRGNERRGLQEVDLIVTTLDRFCADHGVTPGLMKIDVDGYEGKILRGAETLLRTARPAILLELHADKAQREGILRTEVADMLFDADYSALFLTDHEVRTRCEIVPVTSGHPLLARQQTDMIVFVPNGPSR